MLGLNRIVTYLQSRFSSWAPEDHPSAEQVLPAYREMLDARAASLGLPAVKFRGDVEAWLQLHRMVALRYMDQGVERWMRARLPLELDRLPLDLGADVALALADVLDSEPLHLPERERELYPLQPDTAAALPEEAPRLVAIAGGPRNGKDLAADMVESWFARVERFAFSDAILDEVNDYLAPTGHRITEATKSTTIYRHVLQAWSMARYTLVDGYWTERVSERIQAARAAGARLVIVTGLRLPSDVAMVQAHGGEVWRVQRPGNTYRYSGGAATAVENGLDGLPPETFRIILNPAEGDLAPYEANVRAALGGITTP